MAEQSRLWLSFHHLSIFVFLLSFIHGHSFGDSPHDFHKGETMVVKANKLTSNKSQLSYPFYSVPYCRPHQIINSVQNLGAILRGDRIQNSLYHFEMRANRMCNIVCSVKLNEKTANEFKEKIDHGYRANMILDNLPLVVPITRTDDDSQLVYQLGYYVGGKTKDDKYFINNHLSFIVRYHQNAETPFGTGRIVGFEAKAFSIIHKHNYSWSENPCLAMRDPLAKGLVTSSDPPQEIDDNKDIFFTYDVEFQSDVKWASRWNTYILTTDDQISWFPIVNSFMNILLISGMVAAAMSGAFYRYMYISYYNQLETLEEAQEETGWKLVRTDVFRPPVNSELLCVYVGTGVQLFGMIVITIIFGLLGFLSPSNTGGLMIDIVLLWALMGIFGGFAMARLYKTFEGSDRIACTLKTACMFPGLVFCILFALNVVTWSQGSWGVVPFGNMFVLARLWFGFSVPLVFIGSYIGFKQPGIKDPEKTNKIPREIPEQSWYTSPFFSIMIGGIIPFGVIFNELFSTFASIGLPQFYYMFGLLIAVLIIICAEVTIFMCYLHLCGEDYRWWWRSYLTSGSSAFYLFIYATFYFFTKLSITELVPGVFYFGYMLIASFVVFMLMGTIGLCACWWFTRLIYSSLKIV